uniref:Integrase core domain containing protein n=1 Tax=Solanum tuberosum TaxID=4113 RepID=M1DDK8_SOLTU
MPLYLWLSILGPLDGAYTLDSTFSSYINGYSPLFQFYNDLSFRTGQGGNNGRAQSTTSATPAGRLTERGNSFGTYGGQRQNRLYALHALQDQEDSSDVVTGFTDQDTDHSSLTSPWTQYQSRGGGPRDPSRGMDHLTNRTSTHGYQTETT